MPEQLKSEDEITSSQETTSHPEAPSPTPVPDEAKVADIILSRVSKFNQINTDPVSDSKWKKARKKIEASTQGATEEEIDKAVLAEIGKGIKRGKSSERKRSEIFEAVAKDVWKDFVVHGRVEWDKKSGQWIVAKESDLDCKASLVLLGLAGIDTSGVEYVRPGEKIEGKTNIDTGNADGLVVEFSTLTPEEEKERARTVVMDHHGEESRSDTSATRVVYDTLKNLGLLKEGEVHLDKFVEFVTMVDNATFYDSPEFKEKWQDEGEKSGQRKYFEGSWRTLFGLWRDVDPQKLINFFKDNSDPNPAKILNDEELASLGISEEVISKRHKGVYKSVKRMEDMERDGLIVDSESLGKVVIDIGGTIPCGFDAARCLGCGVYIKWKPENNGFFISSVNPLPEGFNLSQGRRIRETMWIRPQWEEGDLTITLGEILSKIAGADFEATGELKEYLEANLRETTPEEKERKQGVEAFEAAEAKDIQEAKERKHADFGKIEISDKSRETIKHLLIADADSLREKFSIKWFEDHKDYLKSRGIPCDQATDDYKIKFVLSHWEDGDFNIGREMREQVKGEAGYKKEFGDEVDKLQILKIELSKERGASVEAPFLLLNYLQKRIDEKTREIESLRKRSGGAVAIEIASKEKEVEQLYAAAKDLAGQTMGEDIDADVKKKADEELTPERKATFLKTHLRSDKESIQKTRDDQLILTEWQKFLNLSEAEQQKFLLFLGDRIGRPAKFKTLEEFGNILFESARTEMPVTKERKIDDALGKEDFYALLKAGYKPYEAVVEGYRGLPTWLWGEKVVITKIEDGKEVVKKMSTKEFDLLVIKLRAERKKDAEKTEEEVKKKLDEEWDKNYQKTIRTNAEERVRKIATSAELAEGKIEELYSQARDRLIQEYVARESTAKKEPAETTAFSTGKAEAGSVRREAKPEKGGGDRKEKFAERILDAMRESELEAKKKDSGAFAGFGENGGNNDHRILNEFFRKRGLDAREVVKNIPPDKLKDAWASRTKKLPDLVAKIASRLMEQDLIKE